MNDSRLNSLEILNTAQLSTSFNYDDINEYFARSKARQKI